eukprot:3417468-Rhodomonas_salina.1
MCTAICGTGMCFAASRSPMRRAVLRCYAACGTKIVCGAMRRAVLSVWCYAIPGTDAAYGAMPSTSV